MNRLIALSILFLGSMQLWGQALDTEDPSSPPAVTYTDIHDFVETDGCCTLYPSMLAQGEDGNIYGATTSGGVGYGNIFMIPPSGTFTNLYNFSANGLYPQGGISLGTDGNFYGATYQGGTGHAGTLFQITASGTEKALYNFTNTTDGAYPRVPPVQAGDGNYYGTTANGTVAVLYQLTGSGTFKVMVTLAAQSYSPLLLATDGNLYGTTLLGGTFGKGTIFKYSPGATTVTTLFNFQNEFSPTGPLIQGVDGKLYGTASTGGTGDGGAIFHITTGGTYKVIYNFSTTGATDGRYPYGGVVQGSDNKLYGVASTGGANSVGTLFNVSTSGSSFQVLYNFATATGSTPYSALLLHTNGTIYGITYTGGAHGYGCIYSVKASLKAFVKPLNKVSAKVGSSFGLLGQGFNTATGVTIGAGTATPTIKSDTYMTAKPVAGATTAQVIVDEPSGNLSTPLTFNITPTISSFSPASGPVGTVVVITGQSLTGATKVKFGGIAATSFTINSNTQVTATVPTGAVTGKIKVTTAGGTATSSTNFTVQ